MYPQKFSNFIRFLFLFVFLSHLHQKKIIMFRFARRFRCKTGCNDNNDVAAATDIFTSAFIRACADTSRLDQATAVNRTIDTNNNINNFAAAIPSSASASVTSFETLSPVTKSQFDFARAQLVTHVRNRDWERALQLLLDSSFPSSNLTCSPLSIYASSSTHNPNLSHQQQQQRAIDIPRLTDGVDKLIRRVFPSSSPQPHETKRRALRLLGTVKDQQRRDLLILFRDRTVISESTWNEALSYLDASHAANRQHQRHEQRPERRRRFNDQHRRNENHNMQTGSNTRLGPSECQTILTKLLHRAKQEKKDALRRRISLQQEQEQQEQEKQPHKNSQVLWSRALEVLSSLRFGEMHAAHVNACLGVLCEQDQYDRAVLLAKKVLEKSNDSVASSYVSSSSSSSSSSYASSSSSSSALLSACSPTPAMMVTIAALVRDSQDASLAEVMLLPRSKSSSSLFPFAAWAACNVLRRRGKWEIASSWYLENIHFALKRGEGQEKDTKNRGDDDTDNHNNNNNHIKKPEKFSSHLKLTSCIAKCLLEGARAKSRRLNKGSNDNDDEDEREEVIESDRTQKENLRKLALDVMKDCTNVEGYERIVDELFSQWK